MNKLITYTFIIVLGAALSGCRGGGSGFNFFSFPSGSDSSGSDIVYYDPPSGGGDSGGDDLNHNPEPTSLALLGLGLSALLGSRLRKRRGKR